MKLNVFVSFIAILCRSCRALDNGLAQTPPLGWILNEESSNENAIKQVADTLVSQGYRDVGYEYLIIGNFNVSGGSTPREKDSFPEGMKKLSNYIHSKGLKLGISLQISKLHGSMAKYTDERINTDTAIFAEWGIDYVDLDDENIRNQRKNIPFRDYFKFGKSLNQTRRSILYSCGWVRQLENIELSLRDYQMISNNCNTFAHYYTSSSEVFGKSFAYPDKFASLHHLLQPHTGPGHWSSLPYLDETHFRGDLKENELRMIMCLWAILASPIIIQANPLTIDSKLRSILRNKNVLDVNQDPLGLRGYRVSRKNYIETWIRPITPVIDGTKSFAIGIIDHDIDFRPRFTSISLNKLGLNNLNGYRFLDLYGDDSTSFISYPNWKITIRLVPDETESGVVFLKATALPSNHQGISSPYNITSYLNDTINEALTLKPIISGAHQLHTNFSTSPDLEDHTGHLYYFIDTASDTNVNLSNLKIIGLNNFQPVINRTLTMSNVTGTVSLDFVTKPQARFESYFTIDLISISVDLLGQHVNVEAQNYTMTDAACNVKLPSHQSELAIKTIESAIVSSIMPSMKIGKIVAYSTNSSGHKTSPFQTLFTMCMTQVFILIITKLF